MYLLAQERSEQECKQQQMKHTCFIIAASDEYLGFIISLLVFISLQSKVWNMGL